MRSCYPLLAGLVLATLIAGCSDSGIPTSSLDEGAPELATAGKTGTEVAGRYIVVFRDDVANPAAEARRAASGGPGEVFAVYEHAIKGFAIANLPEAAAAALERNPLVAFVEPDREVQIAAQTVPTGVRRIFADDNANLDIDGTDDYRVDVDVAIIDTGIDFQHPDLNVAGGVNCTVGGLFGGVCEPGGDDDHYHGTHVGGTVGALDNDFGVVGVAPGARLWAVKVLNKRGSGYTSWIIAGIDWVAANAATIEVANMSLGGSGYSTAEFNAIQGAVNKGVAFAVAAGNSDADAANYSPAAFNNVLTVSALADFNGEPGGLGSPTCRSDVDDTLADFSNWGSAVDIAAPGVCILSTYPLEKGEYGTISGTSMASPHVAGALALKASMNNPANATDVGNLYDAVVNAGNLNWTDDSGDGIKEPLLDLTGFAATLVAGSGGGGGGGGENTAPSASISSPSDGATFDSGASISFVGSATDTEDGNLTASLVWSSNQDGQIGTGGSFSAATLSVGTHIVTASVTDSGGLGGDDSVTITVQAVEPPGSFLLSVSAYKVKGSQQADLTWSGATSTSVDVVRNGAVLLTTANDGAYTDATGVKGGGTATYQVCEAGTTTCSNAVNVTW